VVAFLPLLASTFKTANAVVGIEATIVSDGVPTTPGTKAVTN